ncbi:MAG: hypothetical protein OEZ10_00925 [Gammaproteobacteria bacterium]|nr:hypothetical protein [Gammaproteobacteria bacterium]
MKNFLFSVMTVILMLLSGQVSAAGLSNTVRGGVFANDVGTIGVVEYEKLFGDRIAIGARLGALDYTYEDSSYEETGEGTGAEVLFRLYPSGEGFKGFYFGAGLGYWHSEWEFYESDLPFNYYYGSGETESINLNVGVGWKIPLGSRRIYLDPSIHLGNYFGISNESVYYDAFGNAYYDDAEPELGLYIIGGIAFGVAF